MGSAWNQNERNAVLSYRQILMRGIPESSPPTVSKSDKGIALETPYVFWYSERKNFVDFPSTLKQFSRFETLEEFRNIYSRIGKPSDIPDSNMFLFREGVEPLWEKNPEGGHWQILLSPSLVSSCWDKLTMATIGEKFSVAPEEISGIGVCVRKDKAWITVWNRNGSNAKLIETIRLNIKEELNLPSNIIFSYRRHSEYQQWYSIQKQAKVLKKLGRWGNLY